MCLVPVCTSKFVQFKKGLLDLLLGSSSLVWHSHQVNSVVIEEYLSDGVECLSDSLSSCLHSFL